MEFVHNKILKLFNINNGTIIASSTETDMQRNVGKKYGAQIPTENQLGRIDWPVCWGVVVYVPL